MPEKKDFIAIFKAETEGRLTRLDNGLVELEKQPDNLELVKELNREAHTIKGSARVFGYNEIQEIAHRTEDVFDKVARKELAFDSLIANRIFKALDAIRNILGKISRQQEIDVDIPAVCRGLQECVAGKPQGPVPAAAKEAEKEKNENKAEGQAGQIEEFIRVPVSRIDKLLNLTGEMVISKMKSAQKITQAKRVSALAGETYKDITGLEEMAKTGLTGGQFGKLLARCNCDIQRLREESLSLYDSVSGEAMHLEPVIDELQDKMKQIKMIPCSTIFELFPRMVRDISSQQGKEVDLEISGGETELDKKVLEEIKTPLTHILRNCIDHGIERPQAREALGKPRRGTVRISAFHKAGNVIIEIEDDGRGIDVDEIKRVAMKKRLTSEQELEAMTEKEIRNFVFKNGFSTSPIITDVSGRGIGLDIVRRDIENLRGQVSLESLKDQGTKFTLVLPLTIAIIQVLLVRAQGMVFAVPMVSIEETILADSREISTIEGRMAIPVRDHILPVVKLSEVLGLPAGETPAEAQPAINELSIVIAASLDKRVGFIVDEIVGEEEIFLKSLGAYLGKIKNVSGAAILGAGEVVVVLDTADLIVQSRLGHPAALERAGLPVERKKEKKILVVEDALSIRELETSILEAQGYTVDTAVDGLDGLDKVAKVKFDLVVTDIQMPRMDGFEFCRALKKSDEYKEMPVVIVTALEKEEDKRRGIEAGAAAYIVKNAFDQANLLDTVERLIGE